MNNIIPFLEKTQKALGEDVILQLRNKQFCILGCGAVGTLFAEMLVRSGATKLSLIDGDHIEASNLSVTTTFLKSDVSKNNKKVGILKKRLNNIAENLQIDIAAYNFREPNLADEKSVNVKDLIASASYVIIAMDRSKFRILAETLCARMDITQLSIGIETKPEGDAFFECAWNMVTLENESWSEGYGHGSYASIVIEATAAGFGILLSHLANKKSKYNYLGRIFKNHQPIFQAFSFEEIEDFENKNSII